MPYEMAFIGEVSAGGIMSHLGERLSATESNIVDFEALKMEHQKLKDLKSYKNYVKMLDSQSLINEIQYMSSYVTNSDLKEQIITQVKCLLEEVSGRTGEFSPRMATSLQKMKSSLLEKMC